MKILQIFSRYFHRGGEEVFSERFRRAVPEGWQISDFEGSSAAWLGQRLPSKLTLPARLFYDQTVARALREKQAGGGFDVWVVQNALPGLTPAVYQTAFALGVPVIQYLHNYRMGCTNGFFLNHGRPCEKCLAGNFWPAFTSACWRESRLISGTMGLVLRRVRHLGTFQKVAAWIALNHHQKKKHEEMGIPGARIHVVPHFFSTQARPPPAAPCGDVLFLGRLSPEKGVRFLLQAWKLVRPGGRSLLIAGRGPEEAELKELAGRLELSSVHFLGFLPIEDQARIWAKTSFSVLPSIWHEPFPLAFLESWSFARPVLASRLGAMAENVEDGIDGMLVEPFSPISLAKALQAMIDQPTRVSKMGQAGWLKVHRDFNQEVWRARIQRVFSGARFGPS